MPLTRRPRPAPAVVALALTALACCLSAAPASASCSLAATNGTVTRTLAGRTYQLHVPAGLTGPGVPLLMSLHGAGSNGQQDELSTGWSQFADGNGLIVAYPNAQGAGSGVWDPYMQGSPDVPFLRQVADDIAAGWCIDPRRIYVDGWSNGAVMSQRVACDAGDRFAAVTSYGGGSPTGATLAAPCRPSRPMPVGLFVGQYDFTYAGLASNVSEWQGYSGCGATPVHSVDAYGTLDTYACAGGAQVLARVVANTSHNWPFGVQADDQRARMWAFFQAHPLP